MNTQHDITVSGKPLNPPKPPAKPHMLLWIDTETTGISRTNAKLLEIGMIVTSMDGIEEHDRFICPVRPDKLSLYDIDPKVLRMHLDNGLLDTVMDADTNEFGYANVARNLYEWMQNEATEYELHPAGTNVDYDIDLLTNQLGPHLHPDWLRQLTNHRKLDLSTYRLSDMPSTTTPTKTTRATTGSKTASAETATTTPPTSTSCEPDTKASNHEHRQTNTRNPHGDPRHPRAHGMRRNTQRLRPGHREQPRPRIRPLVRTARRQRGCPMLLRLRRSVMRLGTHRTQGQAMNAHTATPDRPNPVIELIRRLRKATHRPEPANDPTICAICGAPLTDSTSSICPDCRELEKDW